MPVCLGKSEPGRDDKEMRSEVRDLSSISRVLQKSDFISPYRRLLH